MKSAFIRAVLALVLFAGWGALAGENLLADPSFEQPMPKNRFGHVFTHWSGWNYEGQCEFRVSDLAHRGQHSLLIVGGTTPKIRASPGRFTLDAGRYRVTAWLRGLRKARVEQCQRTLAQPEVQVGLVGEVDVEQGARDARAAGHLVHRQCVDARNSRHRLGRIEDVVAAAVFFLEAAFGDIVHGRSLKSD